RALPLLRRADQRSGHRSLLPSRVDDVAPLIVSPKPAPLVDSAATEIRRTLPASAAPYRSAVARREVCSPSTLGGSPVREIRSPGFVRGAALKGRPYRNSLFFEGVSAFAGLAAERPVFGAAGRLVGGQQRDELE